MALSIGCCPFRLLFKHPFATSHGVRDGTESVFVRVKEAGFIGYGEATLPPYLKETPRAVIARLTAIAGRGWKSGAELLNALDRLSELEKGANGCRNALHTALIDLAGKRTQRSAAELLACTGNRTPIALMTLGISTPGELVEKLNELPQSGGLKVKVNGPGYATTIARINKLDNRPLLIDANQGLQNVDDALALLNSIGEDQCLGMEQPFDEKLVRLNDQLKTRTNVPIIGDESLQNLVDLETKGAHFSGVNVKLMKCGGLDRAKAMIDRARTLNMKVMLGSMSESSLGCTAMAQLVGEADLADLDGPWLIRNDPFTGISMRDGTLGIPVGAGIGAVLKTDLGFINIGA